MTYPAAWLATAVEIVRRAGAMQLDALGGNLQVRRKGAIDLVTAIDVEVERMGRAVIAQRFPDHEVLAEELGNDTGAVPARCRWVFDPLDGTVNFAHGLPVFCSCLALELDRRPVVAAVFDPTRQELFTAERGGGARLNDAPLRVSDTDAVLDAMLCTGFPYDVHQSAEELVGLFGAFVARARAVRRLGSAALDLCYLAAGRFDGFWEQRLHPWDMSAASLVVEEAGGRLSRFDGAAFDTHGDEIVASNGRLHDELLRIIASRARGPAERVSAPSNGAESRRNGRAPGGVEGGDRRARSGIGGRPARRVREIDWTAWRAVDAATLVFAVENGRILLIRKKRGLGAGKINGPGGRREPGESFDGCAVREVREELGVTPLGLVRLGQHCFQFVDGYSTFVRVYRASGIAGEPVETDEAVPLWFDVEAVPFDEMWEDDRHWLPLVVEGRRFAGRWIFDGDRMLDHILDVLPPASAP